MSKHNNEIGHKLNSAWVTNQEVVQIEETEDNHFELTTWAEFLGLKVEDNNNGVLVSGGNGQTMQVEY